MRLASGLRRLRRSEEDAATEDMVATAPRSFPTQCLSASKRSALQNHARRRSPMSVPYAHRGAEGCSGRSGRSRGCDARVRYSSHSSRATSRTTKFAEACTRRRAVRRWRSNSGSLLARPAARRQSLLHVGEIYKLLTSRLRDAMRRGAKRMSDKGRILNFWWRRIKIEDPSRVASLR